MNGNSTPSLYSLRWLPLWINDNKCVENLLSCLTWTLTWTLCLLPVLDLGTAPVDAEGP